VSQNDITANLSLPLPYVDNDLTVDVQRLRDALTDLDTAVFGRPVAASVTAQINTAVASLARSADVTTQINTAVAALIGGAPGALDTLKELADAVNDDASFAATVTNALTAKAPLASPTFTGTVNGITAAMVGLPLVNNTPDANKPVSTATQTALDLKAPLASPAFTGAPTLGGRKISAVPRIAIIGDSLSAQNGSLPTAAHGILQENLSQMGAPCQVISCARDGHNFYRANTVAFRGGRTSVQEAIAYAPEIVLVCLGVNDAITNNDSRTLAQIQSDASTLFSTLRTALPSALIFYVSEMPFDSALVPSGTGLVNKSVLPAHWTLRSTGIYNGKFSSEIQNDSIGAAMQTKYDNWRALDASIKALGTITGSFPLNMFRLHRMGANMLDGLHLNTSGQSLAAGYYFQGIRANCTAVFPNIGDNNLTYWDDPDTQFTTMFSASGTDWIQSNSPVSNGVRSMLARDTHPDTWYAGYNAKLYITPTVSVGPDGVYLWKIDGAKPGAQVSSSVDGAALVGLAQVTDPDGNAFAAIKGDALALAAGPHQMRYAVDNVLLGPLALTVNDYAAIPWIALPLTAPWVPYDSAQTPVFYWKDRDGFVHLRGSLKDGSSGTSAFTLPVGYRPTNLVAIGVGGANVSIVSLIINTDGTTQITGSYANSLTALDGVIFNTR
jgi:lysophospholipase L1-like esterase